MKRKLRPKRTPINLRGTPGYKRKKRPRGTCGCGQCQLDIEQHEKRSRRQTKSDLKRYHVDDL